MAAQKNEKNYLIEFNNTSKRIVVKREMWDKNIEEGSRAFMSIEDENSVLLQLLRYLKNICLGRNIISLQVYITVSNYHNKKPQ